MINGLALSTWPRCLVTGVVTAYLMSWQSPCCLGEEQRADALEFLAKHRVRRVLVSNAGQRIGD